MAKVKARKKTGRIAAVKKAVSTFKKRPKFMLKDLNNIADMVCPAG